MLYGLWRMEVRDWNSQSNQGAHGGYQHEGPLRSLHTEGE